MNKLKKLRKIFKIFKLDGYIVPKNDEFFGEYVDKRNDRLNYISSFSGSAGYALILKKKSYLFVDGRYTLQAKKESDKIMNKYPSRIPIIVEKAHKCHLNDIDKQKYLAPKDLKMNQFLFVIRGIKVENPLIRTQ